MSDARTVIEKVDDDWRHPSDKCDRSDFPDAILAALADAGLTPPIPTGRLHKALQDAFQAGGIEAVETLQKPGKFLTGKHIYCDKELEKLLEGSK